MELIKYAMPTATSDMKFIIALPFFYLLMQKVVFFIFK